ncbi:hypothetical protein V6N12_048618 [Hibiscus sabdariffa]|uniref:Uncharacterized protein n=1 Tax=Hibiscus sabdariffa TaxID=183260 RepID=A0ABR2EHT6_9ROSI
MVFSDMGGACVCIPFYGKSCWRPEKNPLDLNNLPDDYARDGKVVFEEGSSSYERETETLNRARQLVFNNDSLGSQGHLGCHPSYDPTLPFRSVYPPRMFPGSSSTLMPPPPPYLHSSPSRLSSYPINDYYVGHIQNPQQNLNYLGPQDSNYTCIGAPVGHGFGRADFGSLSNNQEEGLNWGSTSYAGGTQQRLENPSAINRFQDGF